ncbi:hypothetical protein HYPSUDRAFT_64316 [Hypholoma sublateritium FD-334 SS-4]|uniref:DUF4246 domain-containing protein n=1 Tax=Hypholoma sublateritium (strain FD-334 SS-4) TaxID=945553 RepID=A0A0D2P5B7_HYPSF|nr:hypothetical protein HYPSUDRAFT_64316 [Hypholoma sublateritium FD-334 SS-4]
MREGAAANVFTTRCLRTKLLSTGTAGNDRFPLEDTIEIRYEQWHYAWLPVIYGCEHDGPSVQDVGSVDTREGRLLTFPNILQHRVNPFKLVDPTKPVHRKIVALFLVDPNIQIISTAHVPCQRQDWWLEAGVLDQGPGNLSLPRELQDKVLEDVDFPFSLREAKTMREKLMAERKEVSANYSEALNEQFTISLCEH